MVVASGDALGQQACAGVGIGQHILHEFSDLIGALLGEPVVVLLGLELINSCQGAVELRLEIRTCLGSGVGKAAAG